MSMFNNISSNELAYLSNALAVILAADNTSDENNVLGNFLEAVGQIILLIAAQQQNLSDLNSKKYKEECVLTNKD